MTVEVVQAEHAVHGAAGIVVGLEFLGELVVGVDRVHVGDLLRQRVEVDVGVGVGTTHGGDGFQRPILAGDPVHGQRAAVELGVVDLGEAAAGVEIAVQRLVGRVELVRHEHLGAARVGVVAHAVDRQLHVERAGREETERGARGVGVLVAVAAAGEDVLAEAVVVAACVGDAAAPHLVGAGAAQARLDVLLAMGAAGDFHRTLGFHRQRVGDVLDRAADGVLAVQRALRAAQHLDAADVEHVQHRTLRTGQVHVVEIDAHARVEAPGRVCLADAADIGGERGVGAARGINLQRRDLALQVGQALHVLPFQRLRGEGADRDRHVLQGFFALACSDHHGVELLGVLRLGGIRGDRGVVGLLRVNRQDMEQAGGQSDRHTQRRELHDFPSQ